MRIRVAASAALFIMVALVSAPWLHSESDTDVPHFNAGPPLKSDKLPPILTKDRSGDKTRSTRIRSTLTNWRRRSKRCSTSSPVIVTATAAWDTTACIAASRACMAPSAPPACRSSTTPTRCIKRARRPGRFGLASSRAIGSRSTWTKRSASTERHRLTSLQQQYFVTAVLFRSETRALNGTEVDSQETGC